MCDIQFTSMATSVVRALQSSGADFYDMQPERLFSNGDGVPCRHCQRDVPEGKEYLVLSYSPFENRQPYAEVGPIFLCANACERFKESSKIPQMFKSHGPFLIKAYCTRHRIIYAHSIILDADQIERNAQRILDDQNVQYLHIRSARNNCYWCRIDRA